MAGQSIVISRVRQLEDSVGAPLFQRNTPVVRLSEVGQAFLLSCTDPVGRANDIMDQMASASIGIGWFPDTDASDNPIRRATLALYKAKTAGRAQIRIYDRAIQDAFVARRALETEIRRALMQHELVIHYQPQLNNAARITGVEALVPWHYREQGLMISGYLLAASQSQSPQPADPTGARTRRAVRAAHRAYRLRRSVRRR